MVDHEWTLDIEHILDKIRQNSAVYSEYHKQQYYKNRGYLKYFKIPTIILSALSSVFSVGLQSYVEQSVVSVTTCLIGLFVGILNSLELFLAIQSTMENELNHSREFYLLSVDIFKTLWLQREHRVAKGPVYLDEKYSMYCKLVESSVLTNNIVRDKMLMENEMIEMELATLWASHKEPPPSRSTTSNSPWNRLLPVMRRGKKGDDDGGGGGGVLHSAVDAAGNVVGAATQVVGAVTGSALNVVGSVVNGAGTVLNEAGSTLIAATAATAATPTPTPTHPRLRLPPSPPQHKEEKTMNDNSSTSTTTATNVLNPNAQVFVPIHRF